ncbi:MAG: AAA family ATPase [Nitrospirota bacterium]
MIGQDTLAALIRNVERVLVGKREAIELALVALLSKGHLLIEDVPGLGKTILARALAASLAMRFSRIQFVPDLLPSDVTGVSMFNQQRGAFELKEGPIFTDLLLADEINRTTPRTQASLLECMEERQVTIDGVSRKLSPTFTVIATQNPIEFHGTYPLPEAQLDRFFARIAIGYPSLDQEVSIMEMQKSVHPIHGVTPVASQEDLIAMQQAVAGLYVDPQVLRYIARIVEATRGHQHLALGASPRGSLALMRASQAMAFVAGMDFVEPHQVKRAVKAVLGHRLILTPQARLAGITTDRVLDEILGRIEIPLPAAA